MSPDIRCLIMTHQAARIRRRCSLTYLVSQDLDHVEKLLRVLSERSCFAARMDIFCISPSLFLSTKDQFLTGESINYIIEDG